MRRRDAPDATSDLKRSQSPSVHFLLSALHLLIFCVEPSLLLQPPYVRDASSAIIDGEVVVPSADGTTDFSVLQNQLKGKSTKILRVAFDLLYLNGRDLRALP